MEPFQFYKKRDFGSYISDTFGYFKLYWKNFFKNYLTINGLLLIALCAIFYFIFKDFFQGIMLLGADPTAMDSGFFLADNIVITVILVVLGIALAFVFSIFSISYPIVHMNLVESTGRESFTASELFVEMKRVFKRVFVFTLLAGLIMTPIALIVALIGVVTIILLIGFLILLIALPGIMVWYYQGLFIYVNNPEMKFGESLKQAWKIVFPNIKGMFTPVGTSIAMYIIISTITGIFSMIPYIIMMSQILSTGDVDDLAGIGPLMTIIYLINIIFSYILMNLALVQQGLIYYSHQEEKEHIHSFSEIDAIGTYAE